MKARSRIHSLPSTPQGGTSSSHADTASKRERREQQDVVPSSSSSGGRLEAGLPLPPAARGSTTQDSTPSAPGSANLGSYNNDEELAVEVPGLRVHAPWPGLHGACEGCGAPSVSGLGSGPTECEQCHRQIAGGEGGAHGKPPTTGKGPAAAGVYGAGKDGVVAVTSSREIALGSVRSTRLAWAGAAMLAASSLLLLMLLVAWRGIEWSLISMLSPWLAVYLPIPLGLLDGIWSVHCARLGHILQHTTGSCASRGGLCGTAWGCSGPSCALNLGLDLGLFITAVLAALPAGASAEGCGYDCFGILCFPCAPVGGVGMAVVMVLTTLVLSCAAGFKMCLMAPALLSGQTREESFLPW
eukprot:g12660.t1